jgi:hypothetical protein
LKRPRKGAPKGERIEEEDDDVVEVGCSGWLKVPLKCVLSLGRLTDPAKSLACRHPPRCNFAELRDYAMRTKACPVAGCDARVQRTHDVVRDDGLREQLGRLSSATIDEIWLSSADGGVREEEPPPPTPAAFMARVDPADAPSSTVARVAKRRRVDQGAVANDARSLHRRPQRRPHELAGILILDVD